MEYARISAQFRDAYRVLFQKQEMDARLSGRFMHHARSAFDYPAVGDAVEMTIHDGAAIIHRIVDRRNVIVRRAAGTANADQIVAANLDCLFVVCGLDGDFNVRRIERYVALARGCGVEPVIVLNKCDACADLVEKLG